MDRVSGTKGFTNKVIELLVSSTWAFDIHPLFAEHIYGNNPVDFNKYLQLAGLHTSTTWADATDDKGKPMADLEVYSYQLPGSRIVRIGITDPAGSWGKAGLHTGDEILTVNGSIMKTATDFRQLQRKMQIGDELMIEVHRPTGVFKTKLTIARYKQPSVRIEKINGITKRQESLLGAWK